MEYDGRCREYRNTVLARFEGQNFSVINLAYIPTKYKLL